MVIISEYMFFYVIESSSGTKLSVRCVQFVGQRFPTIVMQSPREFRKAATTYEYLNPWCYTRCAKCILMNSIYNTHAYIKTATTAYCAVLENISSVEFVQ